MAVKCPICGRNFRSKRALAGHMKVHKRHRKTKRKRKRTKKLDTLGKVMSKVRKGKRLTRIERLILSGAIDGAKKARSEYSRRK